MTYIYKQPIVTSFLRHFVLSIDNHVLEISVIASSPVPFLPPPPFPSALRLLLDNVDVKVPPQGGVPPQLVPAPSNTSLDSVSCMMLPSLAFMCGS